jgi:hypothetical protein
LLKLRECGFDVLCEVALFDLLYPAFGGRRQVDVRCRWLWWYCWLRSMKY